MGYSPPSTAYEATVNFGTTGLVGTLGIQVLDNVGGTTIPRTTAGIIEKPNGSGLYSAVITAPALEGQYSIVWDDGAGDYANDDLVVTSNAPITVVGSPASDLGPCTNWLDADDVAACCDVLGDASDPTIYDGALAQAQEMLFQLSGRRFPGVCGPLTVRPCRTTCGCGWQVLSRGHIVWNPAFEGWSCNGDTCGCRPLSRVLLSGYVQEITEVLIDGDTVDPDTYRVDQHRWLTRVRDPADPDTALTWPGCQNLDLDEDQEGTFAVTYTYGKNPPASGVAAAVELSCEIYKGCTGQACAMPKGVVRIARQGVVMEKTPFVSWGFLTGRIGGGKGWATGMSSVDAFLNAWNPTGLTKAPVFWSPATIGRYAQRVG